MIASILTIGDEILIGQIVNTNSSWLAQQLNKLGIIVENIVTTGDNKDKIISAINGLFKTSDCIFTTGGLGPTNDDITKKVLCEYFNTYLVFSEKTFVDIKQMLEKRNIEITENNKTQAMVPKRAKIFDNINGTAPGLMLKKNNKILFAMPGVPFEMEHLFLHKILPYINKNFNFNQILHKTLVIVGISEAILAEKISEWEKSLPDTIKLAYLPSYSHIRLRLSSYSADKNIVKFINEKISELKTIIPQNIIADEDISLEELLGKLLKSQNKTLSTAESCTGGQIASMITSVSGSSQYYIGSIISYSNNVKIEELNVNKSDINHYGAVSKQVVEQMAIGVRNKLRADYSIATSGIAGPCGGTPEKPTGTIWIAVANSSKIISQQFNFTNNRKINIIRASNSGIAMLIKMILSEIFN
jgi:nicotinamide-nucleotide amidase